MKNWTHWKISTKGVLPLKQAANPAIQIEMIPITSHPCAPSDVFIHGMNIPFNTMAAPFPQIMAPEARPLLVFENQWETNPSMGTNAKLDPTPVVK